MQNSRTVDNRFEKIWLFAFCLYAVLGMSTMAGMGLGSGLFLLTSLLYLGSSCGSGQRTALFTLARSPYGLLSVLLFVSCALALIYAFISPPLGIPHPRLGSELKKFHYFLNPLFLALAFLHFRRSGSVARGDFWKFWLGMVIFLSVLGIAQFWAAWIFPEPWLEWRLFRQAGTTGRFHAQGLMMFHLSFAAAHSFAAAALGARVLWPQPQDSFTKRAFFVIAALLSAMAVFYTYSRIAWVGLIAIYACLAILRSLRWGLVAWLVLAALSLGVWHTSDTMRKRWEDSTAGIEERTAVWKSAMAMVKDRPWLGVGFGGTGFYSEEYGKRVFGHEPKFASHAHNNVLEALSGTGWIGFLVWLAWWVWVFALAWLGFRRAPEEDRWLAAAAIAGFLSLHINGLTQVNFWDGKTQHTLFLWVGVVLALAYSGKLRATSNKS